MQRYLYISFIILLFAHSLVAQESQHPRRTVMDIAKKQTEMLVRELNIVDSTMRDTIFKLHLKYAKKQYHSYTRSEALQCMHNMLTELKNILTPELFDRFMNRRINGAPRSPHHTCNWHPYAPTHAQDEAADSAQGDTHTPSMPPANLPPDHQ